VGSRSVVIDANAALGPTDFSECYAWHDWRGRSRSTSSETLACGSQERYPSPEAGRTLSIWEMSVKRSSLLDRGDDL
jgi:hypothetical protein